MEELKAEGNRLFASGDFASAMSKYEEAIKANPDRKTGAILHANVAACVLKLSAGKAPDAARMIAEAIEHCTTALELDGDYTKALFRRAQLRALVVPLEAEGVDLALKDIRVVCKRAPNDKLAQQLAQELVAKAQVLNQKRSEEVNKPGNVRALLADVSAYCSSPSSSAAAELDDTAAPETVAAKAMRLLLAATRESGQCDAFVRFEGLEVLAKLLAHLRTLVPSTADLFLAECKEGSAPHRRRAMFCEAWRILLHIADADNSSRQMPDDAPPTLAARLLAFPAFTPDALRAAAADAAAALAVAHKAGVQLHDGIAADRISDHVRVAASLIRSAWAFVERRRMTPRAQPTDPATQQFFQIALFGILQAVAQVIKTEDDQELVMGLLAEIAKAPLFACLDRKFADGTPDQLEPELHLLLSLADRSLEVKSMVSVVLAHFLRVHHELGASQKKKPDDDPAERFALVCETFVANVMGSLDDIMKLVEQAKSTVVDAEDHNSLAIASLRHVAALSALSSMLQANPELGIQLLLRNEGAVFQSIITSLEIADERYELSVAMDEASSKEASATLHKLRFLVAEVLSLAASQKSFQKGLDKISFMQILPLVEPPTSRENEKSVYSFLATSAMVMVAVAKLCAVNENVRAVVFGEDSEVMKDSPGSEPSAEAKPAEGKKEDEAPELALRVSLPKVKMQLTKLFVCLLRSIQENDERSLCYIVEALSYFSVFPWMKECLVFDNENAIKKTLVPLILNAHPNFKLSANGQSKLWFPFASIFENCTKYLDLDGRQGDPEIDEMRDKLARFAAGDKEALRKLYIDPADKDQRVMARGEKLVSLGATAALHALTTQMVDSREKIARDTGRKNVAVVSKTAAGSLAHSMLSVSRPPKTRGRMVQDGGVKSLLALIAIIDEAEAVETDAGAREEWKALHRDCAHGLARLAIAVDPNVAFTEGTATKITSEVTQLLHLPEEGLAQFEALMALTNLCLLGHTTISILLKDRGLSTIEALELSHHPQIQRAAVELACNLTQYEPIARTFRIDSPVTRPDHAQYDASLAQSIRDSFSKGTPEEIDAEIELGKNRTERQLKIWAGLSAAKDEQTALAASGALAMLSGDGVVAERILDVIGVDPFIELVTGEVVKREGDEPDDNDEEVKEPGTTAPLQHRGAEVLKNFVLLGRAEAKVVVEKGGMLALVHCLAKPMSEAAAEAASVALKALQSYKMI